MGGRCGWRLSTPHLPPGGKKGRPKLPAEAAIRLGPQASWRWGPGPWCLGFLGPLGAGRSARGSSLQFCQPLHLQGQHESPPSAGLPHPVPPRAGRPRCGGLSPAHGAGCTQHVRSLGEFDRCCRCHQVTGQQSCCPGDGATCAGRRSRPSGYPSAPVLQLTTGSAHETLNLRVCSLEVSWWRGSAPEFLGPAVARAPSLNSGLGGMVLIWAPCLGSWLSHLLPG